MMVEALEMALDAADGLVRLQAAIDFWQPAPMVAGFCLPSWTAPPAALGTLLALIILSGIAVGALGALLAALLLAHLLLENVLGIQIALR